MIIAKAKDRVNHEYIEKHHILPKSLGGTNKKENLVELTPKEHFICHRLLVKMTTGNSKVKMKKALWAMTVHTSKRTLGRKKITGTIYERIRNDYIQTIKGKPKTEEHRKKISLARIGQTQSQETKDKRAQSLTGGKRSAETKLKMSNWQKGIAKPKTICEHCGKEASFMNYKKWHGKNCKMVKERKPAITIVCEYCQKNVDLANYAQWHGNKCKHRSTLLSTSIVANS